MKGADRKEFSVKTPVLYAAAWMVVGTVHAAVLVFSFGIDYSTAIAEALLLNGWYAVLGVGIYYMVRFTDLRQRSYTEVVILHLSGAALVQLLWLSPIYPFLHLIFADQTQYLLFLSDSLSVRIATGVVMYVTIAAISYLLLNIRELTARKTREAELRELLKDTELSMLRFQINPHFLFNCLNAVSALILTRPNEANRMVIQLSEFMRYSLESAGVPFRTLRDELNHCRQYLDIERVRYGERLKIFYAIESEAENRLVPAMMLQPLAENGVKHGLDHLEEGITLKLSVAVTGEMLEIQVTNPFDGQSAGKKRGTGTGLKNIAARLEALYGRRDLLSLSKNNGIFTVKIVIPPHAK